MVTSAKSCAWSGQAANVDTSTTPNIAAIKVRVFISVSVVGDYGPPVPITPIIHKLIRQCQRHKTGL